MTDDNKSLIWHRVKFLALITVFLSPFIGGWMALYVFDIRPESNNYGSLVQPPLKVDWPVLKSLSGKQFEAGFGKKWTFLLFIREACNEQCRSNLFYMRQIRTLLGRDTPRLQNVLISAAPVDQGLKALLSDYPGLVVIDNYYDGKLYSRFQEVDTEAVGLTPRLYLVDPDQNYMMHYPANIDQYLILDDIKKLMKLSQIG